MRPAALSLGAPPRRSIITMMSITPPSETTEPERLAAWRQAALAYRRARGEGRGEHESWIGARDAAAKAWPACPDPGREATQAIAYAARAHGLVLGPAAKAARTRTPGIGQTVDL